MELASARPSARSTRIIEIGQRRLAIDANRRHTRRSDRWNGSM
jgi:hypothetical protein